MPVIRYYKCGRCGRHMDELEAMVNLTPLCHNDERDCYQRQSAWEFLDGVKITHVNLGGMMLSEYDVIDMTDPIYSQPSWHSASFDDTRFWAPEPEWTEEDEKLRSEWIELEYKKYEEHP